MGSSDEPREVSDLGVSGVFAVLAGFEALYALGGALCILELSGLGATMSATNLVLALCMAVGSAVSVFLVDRVKLRDEWLDPADAASKPLRFAFVAKHARRIRALAVASCAASMACACALHPLAAVLPAMAFSGGVLYAARPRGERVRPKDVFLFKNLYTAVGLTGIAASSAVAAWLAGNPVGEHLGTFGEWAWPVAGATLFVLLRILADAALSDVDDEAADRRFKTATLATRLGVGGAVGVGLTLRAGAAAVPLLLPIGPVEPRVAWACVLGLTTAVLHLVRPPRWRDAVDAAFAFEAGVVWVVLLAFG
ncbi:MAG: hypothetical protein AAGG07_02680 [Planctomycetota bacterium]